MENENPTILNDSDLPTRLRPATSKKTGDYDGIFASALTSSSAHSTDPFSATAGYTSSAESESSDADDDDELMEEPIDEQEIYDLISTIRDPEHPISLGSLSVVSLPDISISPSLPSTPTSPLRTVSVLITPTITHCSLATVIGLGVRVRLEQSLPPRFRVDVRVKEGTHTTVEETNKQLGDKERVAAALENGNIRGMVGDMLKSCR
ncbi:hypothetical protein FQN54_003173 [Arachnomyces sp. PD_36]|nr:hypothetical protein FQN54_003173 [Arachnomyces sp. PD_36]